MIIKTRRTALPTLATVVLALALTGCTASPAPGPAPPVAVEPVTEAPAPETTETPAPVETEVAVPKVGETIPADQVEAARAAGASVYVSPNGSGDGLVIDPAADLPEVIVNDVKAATPPTAPATFSEFGAQSENSSAVDGALIDAGAAVFYLTVAPSYTGEKLTYSQYVVLVYNVPGAREFFSAAGDTRSATKDGAIAAIKPLMDANPGIPLIDTAN